MTPNTDHPVATDGLKNRLALVRDLAGRVSEWAIFLHSLRDVTGHLDGLYRYIEKTGQKPKDQPLQFSLDAWEAVREMINQSDQTHLEKLREVVQQGALAPPPPVPRKTGQDLDPRAVLKVLEDWLTLVRAAANDEGSAVKVKQACTDIQKVLPRQTAACMQQLRHESLSLTTVIHLIEQQLS